MSRLQSIENVLSSINGAIFQELCDSFLILRNENYSVFSRSGSQQGKQKAIKGTPDTFLLLPNGKYIFIEYSTNITKGASKLKDDIEKCLDTDKTGIALSQISEIILCLNFKLKSSEVETLRSLLVNTGIILTIYTLDSLALELSLQHRDLAQRYLGIPIDTGQIVSIEQFVQEYNKASNGIATPLNNPFLHRDKESNSLKEAIRNNDFIIITGAPGVGKTKLAVEVINEFIEEDTSYSAYCVSYKHHTLLEDLYQHFDSEKNYLLFVDDANRIDAFNQIVGFYKSRQKGNFKVILTVRDYAFQEVGRLCQDFNPTKIDVHKFSDEQIKDILESKPFEILNPDYQKDIIRIADGNPRIAIMTALLAKEKQDITVLTDVSDLFEKYFSTFIRDDGQFSNDLSLKCLGIIAFFYTIPFKDKETTVKILDAFEVSYNDFIGVIDKLDKLELVEIQYENVKIPEQNLSTYFFYRSFIKDDLLSFSTLLEKYFFENQYRFRDTVIPANNIFGPNRVMEKLKPYLQVFWDKLKLDNNEAQSLKFLSAFWFYLQGETLEYILNSLNNLSKPKVEEYIVTYSDNEFSHNNQNKVIELLGNFFVFTTNLKEAISLAFQYTRKKPEHLAELIHKIVDSLTFDRKDYQTRYYRQTTLFNILYDGLENEKEYYAPIFLELCKSFLKYSFHHFKGGRKNSFYHYDYPVQNSLEIRSFRKLIWKAIGDNFENYPKLAFGVLESHKDSPRDINKDLMEFDLTFIIPLVEKKLDSESLEHAMYVQNKIMWLQRSDISHIKFYDFKTKFTNKTYQTYLKIDWDRFRDKEIYDFDDFREYDRLKESEIRNAFVFNTFKEVDEFYKTYISIKNSLDNNKDYNRAFDIVIDENFKHNFKIGTHFSKKIIEDKNEINYIPNRPFRGQISDNKKADILWELIHNQNFNNKSLWELSFFESLDDDDITKKHIDLLVETIKNTNRAYISHFEKFARFKKIEPDFFKIILTAIIDQNNNGGGIKLWVDFFDEYFEELGGDIELIKKAYLQQDSLQSSFDYDGKAFLKILKIDANFLLEYVTSTQSKRNLNLSRENKHLGFIWQVDNIESPLSKVFDFCVKEEIYL